ncbi:MAG: hypothetical protein OEY22_01635 [Candidatus Bathyarchaeota archaeon]|nr:hypothetical protein [Candidatus Bathyarchaeota archaeon]MDH5788220.1 hypothetical protein [Candidatus Bathyarchaeota archaeon]
MEEMSVHIHTTIPAKTNKILEELAKTYGTKSRVLEKALETFLRVEEIGSCDDCAVKTKMIEQTNLRETLNLTSIGRKTLDGLLEVAIGNKNFEEFIEEQKVEGQNFVAILKDSVGLKTPTSFKEFLLLLGEVKDLTRLFDIASHNEADSTLVLRTKVFPKMPEIVAVQIAVILEGTGASFDLRIMGDDIIIKMVRSEVFSLRKKEFDKVLSYQFKKRFDTIRPSLFRNNLILVGPGFLHWAEKHLEEPVADMGAMIGDVRAVLSPNELSKEPEDFITDLVSAGTKMNWFRQAKTFKDEGKNTFTMAFQATSPAIGKVAISAFSVMLATHGWKLLSYFLEHVNGSITVKFVGAEDQSLLDQLVEPSAYQTISRQFLDVIQIPRSIFNSFASKVFETDRKKFDDIYRNAGARISNAIRMLARNDLEQLQKLAENFILKNLAVLQSDADVKFVDKEQFTIIFKRIDPMLINSQRILVESIFKELGYEVSTASFQNLLSFKLQQRERPHLEPIPRKIVMENLVDAMSANSVEKAFSLVKDQLDEMFPEDHPWTIREVSERLMDMYRELGIEVEIEYFEGGFTLKYKSCPYYKLVKTGQKKWLCNFRKKGIEYIISRVTHGRKSRVKIIKSLLQNEHPCEYAIFLTRFLEKEERNP